MGACKYGVSLPYLQATMHYIVSHTNTLALQWQEKPTSWMNENKLKNRQSHSALVLRLKMEKWVESWLQNNSGPSFQSTKFSFIDFVLTDRRSLSGYL